MQAESASYSHLASRFFNNEENEMSSGPSIFLEQSMIRSRDFLYQDMNLMRLNAEI